MPFEEFAQAIRAGWLTTMAGLVVVSSAAACSGSVEVHVNASPMPVPGSTAYGNDISWPQCPKDNGGYDLPGPMAGASFVEVGLTDGGSFRANPCLGDQVASVKARHLWTGAYAISTYPTSKQLTRYGGTGKMLDRLERVGAAQARFNLSTMARVGLRPPMVWLDIEHSTRTPWAANADNNNAVIDGVIAGYRAAGLRAGIYSYDKVWKAITRARVLPGVPTWAPVGHEGQAVAAATCAAASSVGNRPWLTQWTDGVRDYNLTCPGVTGQPAHGNLLSPYSNINLARGSRGAAVAVLQRRLGGVNAIGTFGPATQAKVVSFQRARHLTPNGVVDRATWRALGAGTGTQKPPLRGFIGSLFAPT